MDFNYLTDLPAGVFADLTSLTHVSSLTVSLEAIRREQAPALPLHTLSVEGSLLY